MKHTLVAILFTLTACASAEDPQPLSGSLTYGGKVIHSPYRPERWSNIPFSVNSVTVYSKAMWFSRTGR